MYELKKKLESYLRVNLLGLGPRFVKKKYLPGHGFTKVEKHWTRVLHRREIVQKLNWIVVLIELWSRVLLENLEVRQVHSKFPAFYGT
jgi:hypothetical protein